jgi:hypothetical protein
MKKRWIWAISAFATWLAGSAALGGCNTPSQVALYAEATMIIGPDSIVNADVAVRQIEPLPTTTTNTAVVQADVLPTVKLPPTTAQLILHQNAHVGTDAKCNATGSVSANSISGPKGACIGNAFTSELLGNATVASTNAFPLTALPPLPLAPLPPSSTNDITVAQNGSTTLSPGQYGNIKIQKGGSLTLASGAYSFTTIDLRDNAKITANGGGVTVTASDLTTAKGTTIAPSSNFVAGDLFFSFAHDVSIGPSSAITAVVAAPHGTLILRDNVVATGAFAAFAIELKQRVTVNFESGFPAPGVGSQQLTGYTAVYADGSFGAVAPLERDKVFSISLGLPFPSKAAVDAFLADVSNPKSSNYRKYVSPQQFKQQFSPSDADYAQVVRWVNAHGLTVQHTYTNNLAVAASGTADQFERALHANLFYRLGGPFAPGFIAVDREPSLDLEPKLLWISGFTDSTVPRSQVCGQSQTAGTPANQTTVLPSLGVPALGAADLRQAYLEDHQATDTINCLGLTGQGETIGILSLQNTTVSDRDNYFANQPWIAPSTIAPTVPPINVSDPGELESNANGESTLDIEMASAMAPGATVQVFQGPTGVSGHVTDLVNAMATFTPVLSTISNSYGFGFDDNTNQTLVEFAAQGTSFFSASGDYGDISDPSNATDLDNQTLVGGTALNVNQATISGTTATFSSPFYLSEPTWNGGCSGVVSLGGNPQALAYSGKDITGGGVLNGLRQVSDCYATTCRNGISLPLYQASYFVAFPPSPFVRLPTNPELADPTRGNGASVIFRNYPDVSAAATNIATWQNAVFGFSSGTSAAAPLWAGYTALINQALKQSGLRQVGFANPALYAIAASPPDRFGNNISDGAFHDIVDGLFNQEPQPNTFGYQNASLGFPAVGGYDLATGLGSPTCHLLNLLAAPLPLNPPNVTPTFGFVFGELAVGNDDLHAQSGASLSIKTASKTYACPLKPPGTQTGWDPGTVWPIQCPLNPPIAATDVQFVSIILDENGQSGLTADNWDVTGLHLRFGNINIQNPVYACLVNESSDDACDTDQPSCNPSTGTLGDTNDHGVFRLSEKQGSGGQGPTAIFTPAIEQARFNNTSLFPSNVAPQGCPSFTPTLPFEPAHSVHIVLDTGNDGMESASTATLTINTSNAAIGSLTVPLASLPISDRSEIGVDFTLFNDTVATQISSITVTFSPSGNDEWHLFGLSAFANASAPSAQDFCLVRSTNADFVFNSSHLSQPFVVTASGCP